MIRFFSFINSRPLTTHTSLSYHIFFHHHRFIYIHIYMSTPSSPPSSSSKKMENYQTIFTTQPSPTPPLLHDHNLHGHLNKINMDVLGCSTSLDDSAIHGDDKNKKKKREKKVRRERYAFQTRSQVDILDDGYRWRKYGQKSVKNNRFPRSYYRCTHQGCNVKKQVQRLSRDEGVVVTTYEGVHTHPTQKSNNDNFEHILSQMQIYPAGF
ncbi:putative WRKY transcription factor 75 [Acorus gramineus]|uniref:WRKY transcription factor 75 n=1 Tax=Acorus gramineus TaxID=55184 RepID=A0AAV9A482_ACOGR|nr:putative WRKY transcription factor 75 [Acorus gramineus]